MNKIQNHSKFSAKWFSFWLLTIVIHYDVIIFTNIKVLHVQMYLLCMCYFVQPNSALGGDIPHKTSSFLAAVTGRLEAFSPQSRNPLSTSFWTGKAPKICRVSAAGIILAHGPRTNPGKTRTQRRQNQSFRDIPSKMLCVRRFLMMAAQPNTGTYAEYTWSQCLGEYIKSFICVLMYLYEFEDILATFPQLPH